MKPTADLRPRAVATVALAAAAPAGWAGPQGFMSSAGPGAHGLASLGWLALVVFSIAAAVVWLLLAWLVTRRRGSFDSHAPVETGGGQRWIVIGGIAIPVAVLTVLFAASLHTLAGYPMAHAKMDLPEIRVIGHQWWFDVQYLPGAAAICEPGDLDLKRRPPLGEQASEAVFAAPTEIHVPVGRPVEIELITRDVIHSFWVPKLHGKVDLVPGQVNRVRLQADRPGTYEGQCAEYCGVEHAHMRLQVVAESADAYRAWLERQRADAVMAAGSEQVAAGRQAFEAAACALCHTIRGTAAHGTVGPDLTHVGSRQRIAGGMLVNDTANLAGWITDAQAIKPGSQMPSLRSFTGPQLRAVVAYLQSLK